MASPKKTTVEDLRALYGLAKKTTPTITPAPESKKTTVEDLRALYSTGSSSAATEAALPVRTEEQRSLTSELGLVSAENKLLGEQVSYRSKRSQELLKDGYLGSSITPERAIQIADKEWEENILAPITPGFGSVAERKASVLPSVLPPLGVDTSQKFSTPELLLGTVQRKRTTPDPQRTSLLQPVPNWNELESNLISSGADASTASAQATGYRLAFEEVKKMQPDISNEDAWAETQRAIDSLKTTIESGPKLTGDVKPVEGSVLDIATGLQKTGSSGVPDLNPVQLAFTGGLIGKQREDVAAERTKYWSQQKKTTLVLRNGREIDPADYDPKTDGPAQTKISSYTPEEIRAKADADATRAVPTQWWAEPEQRSKVLADPNKFNQEGVFSTTTPFGETVETKLGWALRVPLAPLGIFPAILGEEVIAPLAQLGLSAEEKQKVTEERAKKRKEYHPALADAPYMYNLSKGLGSMNPVFDTADILESQGYAGNTYGNALRAVGVVSEFIDPSVALGSGLLKGGQAAMKTSQLATKLGVKLPVAATAAKAGATAALDASPVISRALKTLGVPTSWGPGDMRFLASADLSDSLVARAKGIAAAESGMDLKAIQASLKPQFQHTGFYQDLAKINPDVQDLAGELRKVGTATGEVENLVKGIDSYAAELKAMAAEERSVSNLIRTKDIARNLGELASVQEDFAAVLRAAQGAAPNADVGILLSAVNEAGMLDRVINQEILKRSVGTVIELTKKDYGFKDIVRITDNTFAPAGSQDAILNYVREKTNAGFLAQQLSKQQVPIVTRTTERGAEVFYDLSNKPELAKLFETTWSELKDSSRLSGAKVSLGTEDVAMSLGTGAMPRFVRVKDIRTLLDGTIDNVARGFQLSSEGRFVGQGLLRADDIRKLPVARQLDLLEPLESRSFLRSAFRDLQEQFLGVTTPAEQNLTLAQRTFMNRAQNEINSIDRTLRRDIERFKQDEEFRTALGAVDIDVRNMRIEDILGYLIVKQIPSEMGLDSSMRNFVGATRMNNVEQLQEMLSWTAGRYVFTDASKEALFSSSGIARHTSDKILSDRGRTALRELTEEYAGAMADSPRDFISLYQEFLGKWHRDLAQNLTIYVRPELAKDASLIKLGTKAQDLLLIGSYQRIEANRILKRAIEDTFAADTSSTRSIFGEAFLTGERNSIMNEVNKLNPFSYEDNISVDLWESLIKKRVEDIAAGNIGWLDYSRNLDDLDTLESAIDEGLDFVFKNILDANEMRLLYKEELLGDVDFLVGYTKFVNAADDVVGSILRKNGFGKPFTLQGRQAGLEQAMLKLRLLAKDENFLLRSSIGSDAYDELVKFVDKEGVFDSVEKYFVREIQLASSSKKAQAIAQVSKALDTLTEIFYTAVLSLRTRFHGVNFLTAPFILYSSVGYNPLKAISPSRNYKSLLTLQAGTEGRLGRAWNTVAIQDSAGRAYTYGDIYTNVLAGGGVRSATGFELAQSLNTAIRTIKPSKLEAASDSLRNFADSTDNMWRLNVAYDALSQGRSLEEATQLARRAMFDYGDLTSAERALIGRGLVFYTFARQNLFTLLNNLSTVKGVGRVANLIKTERGAERLFNEVFNDGKPVDDMYIPEYATARSVLSRTAYGSEKEVLKVAPAIPTIEAIAMLTRLMSLEVTDITSMVAPAPALILSAGGFDPRPTSTRKIQAHHVALLDSLEQAGVPAWETFELMIGGPIQGKPGSVDEGAVHGQVYELNESQQAAYKKVLTVGKFLGTSTATKDYARLLEKNPELSELSDIFGFLIGASTPISTQPPEIQQRLDIENRIRESRKTTGATTTSPEDIEL